MENDEAISKLNTFFEKRNITAADKYLICQKLADSAREEWFYPESDDSAPEEADDFDDLGGAEEAPKPKPSKKPKISTKPRSETEY